MQWITFGLGIVLGTFIMLGLMALLSANKKDDAEHEKRMAYKDGYEKGFDDGYELRYEHKNRGTNTRIEVRTQE